MRTLHYVVQFTRKDGKGWRDRYSTAASAKAEVSRVNKSTERTGMSAKYLGDARRVKL